MLSYLSTSTPTRYLTKCSRICFRNQLVSQSVPRRRPLAASSLVNLVVSQRHHGCPHRPSLFVPSNRFPLITTHQLKSKTNKTKKQKSHQNKNFFLIFQVKHSLYFDYLIAVRVHTNYSHLLSYCLWNHYNHFLQFHHFTKKMYFTLFKSSLTNLTTPLLYFIMEPISVYGIHCMHSLVTLELITQVNLMKMVFLFKKIFYKKRPYKTRKFSTPISNIVP